MSRRPNPYLQQIRGLFSDTKRFKFVRQLPSNGATGCCVLFAERSTTGQVRKFVVKCPNDLEQSILDGLKNEIKWLHVLRHSEHVVSMLSLHNNPLLPNAAGQGGLGQPSMVLEFLENGTLGGLLERVKNVAIPNRVLWGILLCMTRGCIGMAYPPSRGQPEEIKPGVQPSNLAHWDMHNGNFMFGSLGQGVEHSILPILKLIDFDGAELKDERDEEELSDSELAEYDNELELERYRNEASPRNYGIDANVFTVGLAMTRIILRADEMSDEDCREQIQREHPSVDDNLQLIVVRCLAFDPRNRPRLAELLTKSYQAVLRGNPQEPDAYIKDFTQRYILNANS